jgi:HAD superfamily hydrolase (TIGR01509 family)
MRYRPFPTSAYMATQTQHRSRRRRPDGDIKMLFLFDCDGVLVDSEIIAAKVDAEHLAEVGFTITPEEVVRRFAGLTSAGIVEIVEAEIGKPLPPEFLGEQQAELNRRLAAEVEAVPGAVALLDALDGPRCVCSNSSTDRLKITMQRTGLWDRFAPYIWSAVEVGTRIPKPDPNVYRYALDQFRADPRDTLVVEDSVFGVTAAHAAGARVVGFTGGAHAWSGLGDLLIQAGAETVINRLADVPKVAEAFAVWDGIAE